MPQTLRQQIAITLEDAEYSIHDLAELYGLRRQEILGHLDHVQRSVKKRFKVRPAQCSGCDFVFENRTRLSTPSRCPQCKKERVQGPWIRIVPT